MEPYYSDDYVQLYCADALEVLPMLDNCDAVITDPPYMIGAKSVGSKNSKAGTWEDLMNASYWYSQWMRISWDLLKNGYIVSFTNWRSLPMLLKACAITEIPVHSCAVWDKEWIGPASSTQLRPRYEMLIFCGKGDAVIPNRSAPDVFRCQWMAGARPNMFHPAEKPLDLISEIVCLVTQEKQIVVDPFAGSGTTLVSAKTLSRRAIGCEANEKYAEIAARRLEQTNVFWGSPSCLDDSQRTLFSA